MLHILLVIQRNKEGLLTFLDVGLEFTQVQKSRRTSTWRDSEEKYGSVRISSLILVHC